MAHVLIVGPGMTNYRLPTDTDVDSLKKQIKDAFGQGLPLEIPVQLDDNPLKTVALILNGKATACVAIAEVDRDPGGEPTIPTDLSKLDLTS